MISNLLKMINKRQTCWQSLPWKPDIKQEKMKIFCFGLDTGSILCSNPWSHQWLWLHDSRHSFIFVLFFIYVVSIYHGSWHRERTRSIFAYNRLNVSLVILNCMSLKSWVQILALLLREKSPKWMQITEVSEHDFSENHRAFGRIKWENSQCSIRIHFVSVFFFSFSSSEPGLF